MLREAYTALHFLRAKTLVSTANEVLAMSQRALILAAVVCHESETVSQNSTHAFFGGASEFFFFTYVRLIIGSTRGTKHM